MMTPLDAEISTSCWATAEGVDHVQCRLNLTERRIEPVEQARTASVGATPCATRLSSRTQSLASSTLTASLRLEALTLLARAASRKPPSPRPPQRQ